MQAARLAIQACLNPCIASLAACIKSTRVLRLAMSLQTEEAVINGKSDAFKIEYINKMHHHMVISA